jgi:anti-anti-sigma factor
MEEITVWREGTVDVVGVRGEVDMSNVERLNDALRRALSDESTSCLLDLSEAAFLDSSVVRLLILWSNDAQLSEREALAIQIGQGTPAQRLFELVGLIGRLPLFAARESAMRALLEGQRARDQRGLEWLTDAELDTARTDAQAASDAAGRRLDDITEEEGRRDRARNSDEG